MQRSIKTGRNSTANYCIITKLFTARIACRISVAISAFLQLPAFFASCTEEGTKGIRIHAGNLPQAMKRATDVFVFNSEEPCLLDSYQQFPAGEMPLFLTSGPGDKTVVALSAKDGDLYSRAYTGRLSDLRGESFSLLDDSPSNPFFFGITAIERGRSRAAELDVTPLMSKIRVRSVSCNFDGRLYGTGFFHNDHLFLVNVVSDFCPLAAEGGRPVSWLNYGGPADSHPYIEADGWGDIGSARVMKGTVLYCYPNPKASPPTRLVLEGTVAGTTCYYPIDLDIPRGGMTLSLDITLNRAGTLDPDSPAAPGTYTVEYSTEPWYESPEVVEEF